MGLTTVFFISFVTALSGALMPGPLLTVTIAHNAKRGFIASVLLVLGHSLLELMLVVGLAFGLGSFMKIRPVLGTITIFGGAMLLWMGWGMIRDARQGTLDFNPKSVEEIERKESLIRHPIITGIMASISNPYWLIWWATIGLTLFAALSKSALGTIGAFYFGHIMGDIIWYLAVGAAISTGRRLMTPAAYRIIVQICAVFLLFLGISFLYLVANGGLWKINMSFDLLKQIGK